MTDMQGQIEGTGSQQLLPELQQYIAALLLEHSKKKKLGFSERDIQRSCFKKKSIRYAINSNTV